MKTFERMLVFCLVAMVLMVAPLASDATATDFTGSLTKATYSLDDTNKSYVTVVGVKEDAKYQELCAMFKTQTGFQQVANDTHYHALSTSGKMYQGRYAADYKAFPTVRVQTRDGATVQEWSGSGIPNSNVLLSELQCHRRCRPNPAPSPQPTPEPAPGPPPQPTPEPVAGGMPMWLICLTLFAGGVAAAWHELSKDA